MIVIFIIQNAHAVNVSFPGAHLRLSLAVALLLAAIAGALLMAAAGTARITYRPFLVLDAYRFADALIPTISDPAVRALPPVGAIDQFVDSTDFTDRTTPAGAAVA